MASPQRNQNQNPNTTTNEESCQRQASLESNHPQMGQGYPNPTMGYPYPPVSQGYPYPEFQHNYPNGRYNYNHNYDNYSQHPNYHQQQINHASEAFIRGIFIFFTTLIIFMSIMIVVTWLILSPQVPTFHVDTFSVTNLNTSSPEVFAATWDSNITVKNPNTRLKMFFDRIENFVHYDTNNVLASSFAQPFYLDTETSGAMRVKLTANNTVEPAVGTWVVEKLAKDRTSGDGKLRFSLRIGIWATFKSETWWTRHTTVRVYCEDLIVGVDGNLLSGENTIRDCMVYV